MSQRPFTALAVWHFASVQELAAVVGVYTLAGSGSGFDVNVSLPLHNLPSFSAAGWVRRQNH